MWSRQERRKRFITISTCTVHCLIRDHYCAMIPPYPIYNRSLSGNRERLNFIRSARNFQLQIFRCVVPVINISFIFKCLRVTFPLGTSEYFIVKYTLSFSYLLTRVRRGIALGWTKTYNSQPSRFFRERSLTLCNKFFQARVKYRRLVRQRAKKRIFSHKKANVRNTRRPNIFKTTSDHMARRDEIYKIKKNPYKTFFFMSQHTDSIF